MNAGSNYLTFLCKLGVERLDGNKERKKERKAIKDELKKANEILEYLEICLSVKIQ
jgi:hypothetical protein